MSKVRLTGSTSGYTEIQASAVAGDNTLSLPTTTDGTLLAADSSGNVNLDSGTFYVDAANNRVGVGTTSPGTTLDVAGTIKSNNGLALQLGSDAAIRDTTNGGSTIYFDVSTGGTAHGAFDFRSSSAFTSRLYISTAGNVGIGTGVSVIDPTSGTVDGFFFNVADDQAVFSREAGAPLVLRRRTNDGAIQGFYRAGTPTPVGTISVTTSSTAYNTSSDYRLKENVVPLTGASDRVNQLQVHRFNFIADPTTTVDGFIAHEAQAVVPECVTGTKDEVDENGNPVYQGIDQSKLVPLLTAALQEALSEIADLKTRITALEAN